MSPPCKLFALGSNGSGQLGINHQNDVSSPQPCIFEPADIQSLDPDDRIVKIAAGGNHTLVRFASGAVFAAGSNEQGQCGLPKAIAETRIFRRVRLKNGDGVVEVFGDVAATWEASFLPSGDVVYVRGQGLKGELGLGKDVVHAGEQGSTIDVSGVLGRGVKVSDIRGCMSHVVVLTGDGRLLGWGAGRKGQLGEEGKQAKITWTPKQIADVPPKAAKIAVGRDFTFVAGENERWHCLLGEKKYEDSYLPDLKTFAVSDGEQDYHLMASWSNIYALPPDGNLRGWGRNDRGQLPPKQLPKLRSVAAGSEHCIGLTTSGEVVSWGWGEHGNCGTDTDPQANVLDRCNVLSVNLADTDEISAVAAGCATSFIVIGPKSPTGG